jgi:hypothetical protein
MFFYFYSGILPNVYTLDKKKLELITDKEYSEEVKALCYDMLKKVSCYILNI